MEVAGSDSSTPAHGVDPLEVEEAGGAWELLDDAALLGPAQQSHWLITCLHALLGCKMSCTL